MFLRGLQKSGQRWCSWNAMFSTACKSPGEPSIPGTPCFLGSEKVLAKVAFQECHILLSAKVLIMVVFQKCHTILYLYYSSNIKLSIFTLMLFTCMPFSHPSPKCCIHLYFPSPSIQSPQLTTLAHQSILMRIFKFVSLLFYSLPKSVLPILVFLADHHLSLEVHAGVQSITSWHA